MEDRLIKKYIPMVGVILVLLIPIIVAARVTPIEKSSNIEQVAPIVKPVEASVNTKPSQDLPQKSLYIYKDKVVTLIYHHLAPKEVSGLVISPDRFASHMTMLQDKGYNIISLDQLRQFLNGGTIPDNAVLITFDDGYDSVYKYALPELKKRNMPAVDFAIGSLVSIKNDAFSYSTWRERIEMAAAGLTTQSHTYNMHDSGDLSTGKRGPLLSGPAKGKSLDDFLATVSRDLLRSKNEIENQIKQPVYALALPFGSGCKQAIQAASDTGYTLVFTTQAGCITRSSNPKALPRIVAGAPEVSAKSLDARIRKAAGAK
jgi:peptidoglycan/xylan/chitin deacetylase (PgdA/CDA1 family)